MGQQIPALIDSFRWRVVKLRCDVFDATKDSFDIATRRAIHAEAAGQQPACMGQLGIQCLWVTVTAHALRATWATARNAVRSGLFTWDRRPLRWWWYPVCWRRGV